MRASSEENFGSSHEKCPSVRGTSTTAGGPPASWWQERSSLTYGGRRSRRENTALRLVRSSPSPSGSSISTTTVPIVSTDTVQSTISTRKRLGSWGLRICDYKCCRELCRGVAADPDVEGR